MVCDYSGTDPQGGNRTSVSCSVYWHKSKESTSNTLECVFVLITPLLISAPGRRLYIVCGGSIITLFVLSPYLYVSEQDLHPLYVVRKHHSHSLATIAVAQLFATMVICIWPEDSEGPDDMMSEFSRCISNDLFSLSALKLWSVRH